MTNKIAKTCGCITFAAATVLMLGTQAMAMPVTHSLAVSIDGSAPLFDIPLNTGSFDLRLRGFGEHAVTPFVVSEGDTIETTITFTNGGLTLNDSGENLFELLSFGYQPSTFDFSADNPSEAIVLSYTRDRSTSDAVFSGSYAGDLAPTGPLDLFSTSPSFSSAAGGNFTDTSVTLTSIKVTATYTNIIYNAGFSDWIGVPLDTFRLSVFDEVSEVNVPAPGALLVLIVGLAGFGALRRRAA